MNNIKYLSEFWKENGYEGYVMLYDFTRNPRHVHKKRIVHTKEIEEMYHFIENKRGDRVYITAVPRNIERVNRQVIKRLMDDMTLLSNLVFESEFAKQSSSIDKVWKIDIDTKDFDVNELVMLGIDVMYAVPSVKGYHVLVRPFDVRKLPGVDIQKDNLILLYSDDEI